MPFLDKRTISQYIRRGCKRQLRLYLSPENETYREEREAAGMPDSHPPRPGLQHIRTAGREWEAKKISDLIEVFGEAAVKCDRYLNEDEEVRFHTLELDEALDRAEPSQFCVETEFNIGRSFRTEYDLANLGVDVGRVRPDLIQVCEPRTSDGVVTVSGLVEPVDDDDNRYQLRVIDIKLTAEPSAAYFTEVTYYSIALAGWLADNGLDRRYSVSSEIAVWPGSHEASELVKRSRAARDEGRQPDQTELLEALEDDLEDGPFRVFSSRLRTFFSDELREVLDTPWRELPWHVDHRCIGCEYLGHRWVDDPDEDHCMPTAEREGHLSRVAYISRGASDALVAQGIENVQALADRDPRDTVFDEHHTLRASRTVVAGRATSLVTGEPRIPERGGTSAVMPRWADLRICITVDFDVGSALTLALGLDAFWIEPYQHPGQDRETHRWDPTVFVVGSRDVNAEREELLRFLRQIHDILQWAQDRDGDTTVQFYVWDRVQYNHLTRLLGRHLIDILKEGGIRYLAWLFPPEEVLENPLQASRNAPITVVNEVVRAVLAAPVPYVYSLVSVARNYHHEGLPDRIAEFSVHPHFEDEFSSLIPSERAHEIWSKEGGPNSPWAEQVTVLVETVRKRLRALGTVTRRLEEDLREDLGNTAPGINIGPPRRETLIGWDGQLWLGFAKLNAALEELEIDAVRAMPPHEREARFRSALLSQRLEGEEKAEALRELNVTETPGGDLWVYQLEPGSTEVKVRENEFTWCLAPERDTSVLDRNLYYLLDREGVRDDVFLPEPGWVRRAKFERASEVTVVAMDRAMRLIALRSDQEMDFAQTLEDIESVGLFDLSTNASLEPVFRDFFTSKLRRTLQAIGNPQVQRDDPLVRRALGREFARRGNRTDHTPVADVLWRAEALADTEVERDLDGAQSALERIGLSLNASQWDAWEAALSQRLRLIWGPPGTGKSRTVRAVVLGAIWDAASSGSPLRVLVTAPTYTALDTVLRGVFSRADALLDDCEVAFHRLRSQHREPPDGELDPIDTPVDWRQPGHRLQSLRQRVHLDQEITVVGATPHQVHNLLRSWGGDVGQRELFDLIIVDEASQMAVAESILSYAAISDGGSLIVAGDPLQLAPIQEADPPLGLESMVGSTYDFFSDIHGVPHSELLLNYRSNRDIVDFQRQAGYPTHLAPHSPGLRISFVQDLPEEAPDEWPADLSWGEYISSILDPSKSCVCVTYNGGLDSQWNAFEANIVTSLVEVLKDRLGDGLENERDGITGEPLQGPEDVYGSQEFWSRGVGIVTPHKAQQALIIDMLQARASVEGEAEMIRNAVDTVERFQGQQRDVIIASYAVSDPDVISEEDEFLHGLHRFNVLQSRARAKVVVLLSEELVRHLSSDLDVLRESGLLKDYAKLFCGNQELAFIPNEEGGDPTAIAVKYH